MSGRILDVTEEQYHSDPCERPSLSASIAHELISRSPLHAWQLHPRLGKTPRPPTAAMDNGTLTHALLLGKGEESLLVLNVDSFRTKVAQEARDAAIAVGKTPVKASDYDAAQKTVAILRERILAVGLSLNGLAEQIIEWTEPTRDGDVLCRAKIDHVDVKYGRGTEARIIDVKTTRSGHQRAVQLHILNYGHDIQHAAYVSAVGAVCPDALGRIDFVFLFVETEPPYAVTPVRLNGQWRLIGEAKWQKACATWARCLESNSWPGYADQIIDIEPPAWALAEPIYAENV